MIRHACAKSLLSLPIEEIATGMLGILEYKGIVVRACLEKDKQNILYSYDRDFDTFKIDRKEP